MPRPGWAVVLGLALSFATGGCGASLPPPPATTAASAAPAVRVEPHDSWQEAVLYFVIVDRFADGDRGNDRDVRRGLPGTFHGGDLAGLTAQLDEIAGLGVTALWITPVVENVPGFVTGAGFPDWAYHGYWADDFTRVDRRFGSEEELAELVDAAHARGIAVLLDVVYNHVGYDSRYLASAATRGWLRTEADGSCGQDDVTLCVAGLPDLRTELPQVAEHLFEAHLGRAERTGLDGFRLDTVKHVSHDFWQEHRRRARERLGDDFFLLGEVWGGDAEVLDPWFAGDEMDAGFDFGFQGAAVGFLQGRGRAVAFDRYLASRHRVRPGYLLAHYLSSHDVPTALSLLGGDRQLFRLAALLQMTVAGLPVVFYGEEVGRLGGEWPQNRSDMPWGDRPIQPGAGLPRDEALRDDVRRLIAIRRAHPALWRGEHVSLDAGGGDDLLVFLRTDEASGDAVVVAVNRGEAAAEAALDAPAGWSGAGAVADLWNEESLPLAGARLAFAVPPRGARILALPAQLDEPETPEP
ncbi:MAG TPA: alpha-amylase family glycosyl hydrolase [Thermoanaerobaculia bacterium]